MAKWSGVFRDPRSSKGLNWPPFLRQDWTSHGFSCSDPREAEEPVPMICRNASSRLVRDATLFKVAVYADNSCETRDEKYPDSVLEYSKLPV